MDYELRKANREIRRLQRQVHHDYVVKQVLACTIEVLIIALLMATGVMKVCG